MSDFKDIEKELLDIPPEITTKIINEFGGLSAKMGKLEEKLKEHEKMVIEKDAKISELQQQNVRLFLSQQLPAGSNPQNPVKTQEQIQNEMLNKIIESYKGQI